MTRRIVALAVALVMITGISICLAQEKAGPMQKAADMKQRLEKMIQARVDKMAKDLNLTADQVKKIKAIFQKYSEQARVMMQNLRTELEALQGKEKSEINTVLTPEQQAKIGSMQDAPAMAPPTGKPQ